MKHKNSSDRPTLKAKIDKACKGLIFISETDSPIEVFFRADLNEPTAKQLLGSGYKNETVSESTDPGDFFDRVTQQKEWHTREQIRTRDRYRKLQQLLEKELAEIRVIRIGKVRIDIYVIGKTKDGEVAGIKTFAVET